MLDIHSIVYCFRLYVSLMASSTGLSTSGPERMWGYFPTSSAVTAAQRSVRLSTADHKEQTLTRVSTMQYLGGITARLGFAGVELMLHNRDSRVLPCQTQNSPTCSPPLIDKTTSNGPNPRDRILGLESCTTSGVTSSQETRPAQPKAPTGLLYPSVVPATMVHRNRLLLR